MRRLLTTFVLIGTVDSKDELLATVEINMNPATAQPGYAVIPLTAFPCDVEEGDIFYIIKLTEESESVIICKEDQERKEN